MWRRSWLHTCRSSVQHYISDMSSSSYPAPSYPTLRPSVSLNLKGFINTLRANGLRGLKLRAYTMSSCLSCIYVLFCLYVLFVHETQPQAWECWLNAILTTRKEETRWALHWAGWHWACWSVHRSEGSCTNSSGSLRHFLSCRPWL